MGQILDYCIAVKKVYPISFIHAQVSPNRTCLYIFLPKKVKEENAKQIPFNGKLLKINFVARPKNTNICNPWIEVMLDDVSSNEIKTEIDSIAEQMHQVVDLEKRDPEIISLNTPTWAKE